MDLTIFQDKSNTQQVNNTDAMKRYKWYAGDIWLPISPWHPEYCRSIGYSGKIW